MTTSVSGQSATSSQAVRELATERIRASVRAIRHDRDVDDVDLCELLAISRASLYSRLNGTTKFTAGEVAVLADYFNVPIQDFYTGEITVGPLVATAPPPPPRPGGRAAHKLNRGCSYIATLATLVPQQRSRNTADRVLSELLLAA